MSFTEMLKNIKSTTQCIEESTVQFSEALEGLVKARHSTTELPSPAPAANDHSTSAFSN